MSRANRIWLDFTGLETPAPLAGLEEALLGFCSTGCRVTLLPDSKGWAAERLSRLDPWVRQQVETAPAQGAPDDAALWVTCDAAASEKALCLGSDSCPDFWALGRVRSYCAVFSDIDGTILRSDHTPSWRTVQAIRQVQEDGVPFVLVSARPPQGIRPIARQVGAGKAPIVAYAGALVLDGEDRVLMEEGFSPARAEEIVRRCKMLAPDTSVSIYHGMHWLTDTPLHEGILFERQVTGLSPETADLSDLSSWSILHKILCIGPATSIDRLNDAFAGESDLNAGKSKATFLELTPKAASKSAALRFFCRYARLPVERTMAFGDYFNDVDMLQAAGCGIAMANAPEAVKQAAHAVTSSNHDDGVARILEQKWLFCQK